MNLIVTFCFVWILGYSMGFNGHTAKKSTRYLSSDQREQLQLLSSMKRLMKRQEPENQLKRYVLSDFSARQGSPGLLKRSTKYDAPIGCPEPCQCQYDQFSRPEVVDCSNRSLKEVPRLPTTAKNVSLQNNNISTIQCDSFKHLKHLRYLDLSQNVIGKLPNCSFAGEILFLKIPTETFGNKSMVSTVGVFHSLQNLRELNLSENNISEISAKYFQSMKTLKSLDVSKNKLSKIRNGTFQGLTSLVFLSLQNNTLQYRPGTFESKAFSDLISLEALLIQHNEREFTEHFTYPDTALSFIPTLKNLWMDGYPRALGPGFSSLNQLSQISFRNGFCVMGSEMPPYFFSNVTSRQPLSIDMSNCYIRSLPATMFKFIPTIDVLSLNSNYELTFDGFEKGSEGLQNSDITILDISRIVQGYGYASFIKNTTFRYLKNTKLKVLIVEGCGIEDIDPQAILDLPITMEYISFHDNIVRDCSALATMTYLINLKTLRISNQADSKEQKMISEVHNYSLYKDNVAINLFSRDTNFSGESTRSNLQETRLSKMLKPDIKRHRTVDVKTDDTFCDSVTSPEHHAASPYIPWALPLRLEVLYASDIKVNYNVPKLQLSNNRVLRYFDYSANGVQCFGGPVLGAPSLQYLDLSRNGCRKMSPWFLSHTTNLRILHLYKNVLGQSLAADIEGKTFSQLTSLEILDLSSNMIETLPASIFQRNENIKVLNLSDNVLSNFHVNLTNNKRLEMLDLSYNILEGLTKLSCTQLMGIKRASPNFTVRLTGNDLIRCSCDNLYFLNFLLDNPDIFEDYKTFSCRLGAANNSSVGFSSLSEFVIQLGSQCIAQAVFTVTLCVFFLTTGALIVCALYYYKRWQWKYLYYVGRVRFHIGSIYLTYRPVAHAFVTYDQEHPRLRRLMKHVWLPRLHQVGVTTVLGEIDFVGEPLEPSIAGAVTSTRKTLVFLSPGIFQDYWRRLEVNLAILHELNLGLPVVVPVLLFGQDTLPSAKHGSGAGRTPARASSFRATNSVGQRRAVRDLDNYWSFVELVKRFPPEISTFLQGQMHRCVVYTGDTDRFWLQLRKMLLDE